jgi:hypothetical protein
MKKKNAKTPALALPDGPNEDDIRAYAYHLYEQRGCEPGHDIDDWLEARACLKAEVPPHRAHARLHEHLTRPYPELIVPETDEARHMSA